MIKKLKATISIALAVLVIAIISSIYVVRAANINQQVTLDVVQINEEEFQVIIDTEDGQEFTAFDIEVVGGKAAVGLMKQEDSDDK